MLCRILDAEEGEKGCVDVQSVLRTFNELRLPDAHAVCAMSEVGFGGARSTRPAFAAQLMLTMLLNKTLGKLAPEVSSSCLPRVAVFAARSDPPGHMFRLAAWVISPLRDCVCSKHKSPLVSWPPLGCLDTIGGK